jgi:hypothetical protein
MASSPPRKRPHRLPFEAPPAAAAVPLMRGSVDTWASEAGFHFDREAAVVLAARLQRANLVVAQRPAGCVCDYAVPVIALSGGDIADVIVCDHCAAHCGFCGTAVDERTYAWYTVAHDELIAGETATLSHEACCACYEKHERVARGASPASDV